MKKPKNEGAPRHNCDPKNIAERISEAAMGGAGDRGPPIS